MVYNPACCEQGDENPTALASHNRNRKVMMVERSGEVLLTAFGQTDVGVVRKNNEDAFVIADLTGGQQAGQASAASYRVGARGVLLAVSDGMGGAEAGEVASALVVESLRQHLGDGGDTGRIQQSMQRAVEEANLRVWEAARAPGQQGMGATLVAMLVHGNVAHVAAVGDSRVYLVRRGRIRQVTKDQSYVETLVGAGLMTREQAEKSPYRNVILQAMGQRREVAVALGRIELRRGDVILLCSDGLSGKVTAEEMARALAAGPSFERTCQGLIDLANTRGGEDNITVVIAQVTGAGLAEPLEGESVTKALHTVTEFDPSSVMPGQAAAGPVPAPPARPVAAAPPPVRPIPSTTAPPARQAAAPPPAAPPVPSTTAPTAKEGLPPLEAILPSRARPETIQAPQPTGTENAVPGATPQPSVPPPPAPASAPKRGSRLWMPVIMVVLAALVVAGVLVAFEFEDFEEFLEYLFD